MLTDAFELMKTTEPAHWLRDRLSKYWARQWGIVGCLVPEGYDAYARIYHKAERQQASDGSWEPVRWSTLARENGKAVHPAMTFKEVVGEYAYYLTRPGKIHRPHLSMESDEFGPLVEVLKRHTTTPDQLYVAIWDGRSDFEGENARRLYGWLARWRIKKAKVQLSYRGKADYILLKGSLDDVMLFFGKIGKWWYEMPPDIMWPEDRAWCFSSLTLTLWTPALVGVRPA